VAELVDVAALRAGLQRVTRRSKIASPESTPELQVPVNVSDPASSQLP